MNNLTTHMAELKKILAEIEKKPITEGALGNVAGDIFSAGVKDLSKQGAKQIIKKLGDEVTVSAVRLMGKKKVKKVVVLELKAIPEQDAYRIIKANGKPPQKGQDILTAEQVAGDVEKAVEAGRPVTTNGTLDLAQKASAGPASEAAKNAANMTDDQLEAAIKNDTIPAVTRKEYKEILEKRKATAPKPEIKPDKFDTAEIARENAKKLNREQLEKAIANKDISPVTRKAYEEELAKRPKAEPTPREEPAPTPREEPAPTAKTAEEVAQTKKNAAAKAEAEAAIDAGEVKIKEADLLPAKPGETPSQRVIRTLEEKPGIADKWDNLKGTKGEEGFWEYVKKRKIATLVTALTVAAIAAGVYNNTRDPEEINDPEEVDPTEVDPEEVDPTEAEAAKKKAEEEAAKKKAEADAANKDQGASTTDKEEEDDADSEESNNSEKETVGNSAEQEALLKQINALIAELSKSKDPEIQKRLAAVRAKLGKSDQAASVTSTDEPYAASGWYDIGRGYRRWYGKDGVDPKTGRRVTTGTTDIIPIDDKRRDKYSDMSQEELANLARKNAAAGAPKIKTKTQW